MKLGRIVPLVSLDAGGTASSDTTAVWSSVNIACRTGTIEVETFQIGTRIGRNHAAFNLVVI
jgi:hypothetical protein